MLKTRWCGIMVVAVLLSGPAWGDEELNRSLFNAVESGNTVRAKALIDRGANVNAKDEFGDAPLHTAAGSGRSAEMARLLIDRGADVNVRASDGGTPLHVAAEVMNAEVARLLISRGANVNAKDSDGSSPLHRTAILRGADVARLLIDHGANVNAKDSDGYTPLDNALFADQGEEVVRFLTANGARRGADLKK